MRLEGLRLERRKRAYLSTKVSIPQVLFKEELKRAKGGESLTEIGANLTQIGAILIKIKREIIKIVSIMIKIALIGINTEPAVIKIPRAIVKIEEEKSSLLRS